MEYMKGEKGLSYQSLLDRAADRYCRVSSNTRTGWFDVKIPCLHGVEDKSKKTIYMFEVEYSSSPDEHNQQNLEEDPRNVLNLQYFFIRTELELHKKLSMEEDPLFILIVRIDSKNYRSDAFRISSYLYLQRIMRSRIKVFIRKENDDLVYESIKNLHGMGQIPPLMCIAKQKYNGLQCAGDKDVFLSYRQIAEIDGLKDRVNEIVELYYRKEIDEKTKRPKTNFDKISESKSLSSFQKVIANYLMKVFEEIKGTDDHKIQAKNKKELVNAFSEFVKKSFSILYTPLSQLIWLVLLPYMADMKQLLEFSEQNNGWSIRKDLLEKSYRDAREYADGLLQLIENSCQHTQNGVAYFSMRVHYVDKECAESELGRVAENRKSLIKRFSYELRENKEEPSFSWFRKRLTLNDAPYYVEFQIVDDASYKDKDEAYLRGIPYMFRKNRKSFSEETTKLYHVFGHNLPETYNKPSGENLKNVTYHYGVRQLQKIVLRNKGYFGVRTPGINENTTEIYSACYVEKVEKREAEAAVDYQETQLSNQRGLLIRGKNWQQIDYYKERVFPITLYQIVLPIAGKEVYEWKNKTYTADYPIDLRGLKDGKGYRLSNIFIYNFMSKGSDKTGLKHFTLTEADDNIASKTETVDALEKQLESYQNPKESDFSHTIFQIDFSGLSGKKLEFATKALFQRIGNETLKHILDGEAKKQQLYTLFFSELECVQDFLLDYSVFYNEIGQNLYMDDVQIAICIKNKKCLPEVNFLLAGTSIDAAWRTADYFAHHSYSENTVKLLSQLCYLCDDISHAEEITEEKPVPPFPFDLYLREDQSKEEKEEKEESNVSIAPANESWFLSQLAELIERDLREKPFGCKIDEVHVRLGSRLHIEDFYEAELLFQDVNIVIKLAYLIVQGIFDNTINDEPILVVGYETYSSLLLEYIIRFLKACGVKEAYSAVYGHYGEEGPSIVASAALQNKQNHVKGKAVTVYPIGTTMSTVYQMIDCINKTFSHQFTQWKNYCVLVVENKEKNGSLQNNYWSLPNEGLGITKPNKLELSEITLSPDRLQRPKTKVRYYLRAKTVWHEAEHCMRNSSSDERVLTYVDPTSTIPDMIFPLKGRINDGPQRFDCQGIKDNIIEKRIKMLQDFVSYGHIRVGNNHFLYHLDLPGYFELIREKEDSSRDFENEIRKWSESIDPNAYNIIVAPLEIENTSFVQTIAENVFSHCIRIVRIPFLDARKEDVRSKFSYVGYEYEQIKKENPSIQIHLYYVTMGIVTGQTYYRAVKLIRMLIGDSFGTPKYIFKGVFALVNRSSWSTIKTMVENPDTDFHAYLQLSVPHFNTYQGVCPCCISKKRIEKMMNYCSTQGLISSFARQKDKIEPRTPKEHKDWLIKELWNSPQDFSTFSLWLYRNKESNDKQIKKCLKKCLSIVLRSENKSIILETYKDSFSKEEMQQIEDLWVNTIMRERSYYRLYCTHRSYVVLESADILNCDCKELESVTTDRIIKELLLPVTRMKAEECIEWIISYIKVLSRDYLSKHHYIRQSIYSIMIGMLHLLLGRPQRNIDHLDVDMKKDLQLVIDKCKHAIPLQQYQLIVILFRQLASMQANMVMREDVLEDFIKTYHGLKNQQIQNNDDQGKLCIFPTEEDMRLDYIRGLKMCLLSGDEGNKSMQLQELTMGY